MAAQIAVNKALARRDSGAAMMSRPSVALVAPTVEILGGNAIQARALDHGLRSERYEVLFLAMNPRFPRLLRWLRRYRFVRTVVNEALYVPSLLRIRKADVAHIISAHESSFVVSSLPAILVARGLGKRVVLHYHSGKASDHLARWGVLVHPWLHLVDEIVVPSEYLRAVFARHGYPVRVIRNIVDTARFAYRERRVLRPTLLSTRTLEALYGVDNTLRAFARVRAHYPEATLIVAGFGPEEGRLRSLAASLGLHGVRFVGRVEPEAMPRLYDEADIFLNSSVIDNQPLSVLEAFAAGLPVVSTGVGDLAALVRDGETGLLVPPADPDAMADAVTGLLRNPDRAVAIARGARQEVERYTWPHVRRAWAAIYAGTESPGDADESSRYDVDEALVRRGG
jgi:glycosyltransferase involved in cell wall biosynthesis